MPETVGASDTAGAQLGRILYILAAARAQEGIGVGELGARLGVSAQTIRNDIAEVTGRDFYHEGGWVAEVAILLERDRISVPVAGEFRRPMRLTPREAGALDLALRARAAEAKGEEREGLLELAKAVEKALTAPVPRTHTPTSMGAGSGSGRGLPGKRLAGESAGSAGLGPGPKGSARRGPLATAIAVDPGAGAQEGTRLLLQRAVVEHTPVRIRYLKSGAGAPEDRVLYPYALLAGEGGWYVVGWSPERDGVREFRLDRILAAEVANGFFELPAGFDPAHYTQGGRPFHAEGEVQAVVCYSARVAPWVLEHGEAERCPDGSVVVRHRVADPRWLVREVLRFAGEAVVLEPEALRQMVAGAAEEVAEACA